MKRLWSYGLLFWSFSQSPAPAPDPAWTSENQLDLAQFTGTSFNAWRPYNNPDKLIQVGMNKGEVLAIAGKPDYEESYYQSGRGGLVRVSDWYYIRTGENAETTILKFVAESLVNITSTPTR